MYLPIIFYNKKNQQKTTKDYTNYLHGIFRLTDNFKKVVN